MNTLRDLIVPAMAHGISCNAILEIDIDRDSLRIECWDEKGDVGLCTLPLGLCADMDAVAVKPTKAQPMPVSIALYVDEAMPESEMDSLTESNAHLTIEGVSYAKGKTAAGYTEMEFILYDHKCAANTMEDYVAFAKHFGAFRFELGYSLED